MARYRIGKKYLSQEEYNEVTDGYWALGLFFVGAILTGWLVHSHLVSPDWHKAIRFLFTTVPAIAIGLILVKLRAYIRRILFVAMMIIIIYVVINVVFYVI